MLCGKSLRAPNEDVGVSVVTLLELAHGAARANTEPRRTMRRQFIEELMAAVPIYAVSAAIALRAGQIDGAGMAKGVSVPLSDLLIGVTALELGYGVATANMRHFQSIPDLTVVKL